MTHLKGPEAPDYENVERAERFRVFVRGIYKRLSAGNVASRAADLAYYLLLASIPLVLIFLQLGTLFLVDPTTALYQAIDNLPTAAAEFLRSIFQTLAESISPTSIGISLFVSLWLGSRGIDALIKNINASLSPGYRHNPIMRRAMAVVYTVLLMVILIAMLFINVFYDQILSLINRLLWLEEILGPIWRVTGSLLFKLFPFIVLGIIMILLYKVSPSKIHGGITWREAAVGGVYATLGIFLTTTVYAFIMDNISRLSIHYGSLAGILALLVWLLYVCTVIVSGAEIIAAFREAFRPICPIDAKGNVKKSKSEEEQ